MSGDRVPTLTVVAGPPGAGKSTFIASQSFTGAVYEVSNDARRELLNPRTEVGGAVLTPPREVVAARSAAVEARTGSLVVETTLAGRDAFRLVDRALDRGFRVDAYFVGVDKVDTAIARVEQRIAAGGVGAPNAIVARQFERSLHNLGQLADRADSLVVVDNSQRRAETKVALEHGRLVFSAAEKPAWAAAVVERAEAATLADAQALLRPFRSPELKDSFGRGIDERSVHQAALKDPQTRARVHELESAAHRAFSNPDRVTAGVEGVLRSSPEKYHDAAVALHREAGLRGNDGFFSTERSRAERADAVRAGGDFVRALDRAKGAYDEAAGRYISAVQEQRLRDRVSVPQLSEAARDVLSQVDRAERLLVRDPQEAAKLFRAIEGGPRSGEVFRELQRFETAVRERFGDQIGSLGVRAATGTLPAGVTAEVARLVTAGSTAVAKVVAMNSAADVGFDRGRNSSFSL